MAYQSKEVFPPSTPRRPTSIPTMRLPSLSPPSLLPISSPSARSTSRRLSYTLKNRAARYSLPLSVLGAILTCFFLISHFTAMTPPSATLHNHLERAAAVSLDEGNSIQRDGVSHNGISFLIQDEEELIAEDDLFFDQYVEKAPATAEERAAAAEAEAHRIDVIEHDRIASLRILVWWLAEGGMLPNGWKVPDAATLKKAGARGMEKMLADVEPGLDDEPIFEDGWSEFAKNRYRVVVFSKTYCPYSKKAKEILEHYRISPAPFIIELDHRSDGKALQTILQHLTNRRTVPNVLIDFTSLGGSDELTLLHAEGGLAKLFDEMDVIPGRRRYRRPPVIDKKVEAQKLGDEDDLVAAPVPIPVPVALEPTEEVSTPVMEEEQVVVTADIPPVEEPSSPVEEFETEPEAATESTSSLDEPESSVDENEIIETPSVPESQPEVEEEEEEEREDDVVEIDDSVSEDYQEHLLDTLTRLLENTPEPTDGA